MYRLRAVVFLRRLRRYLFWYISAIRYLPYKSDQECVIVTATNHNHFRSLLQFLDSAFLNEPGTKIVIFDLGMTKPQLDELGQLISSNQNVETRKFPFDDFPPHMNMEVSAGEYAWKPIIVHSIAEQAKGFIIWCDAGNLVNKRLTWVRRIIQRDGIYCPLSQGVVTDWTHAGMISELGLEDKHLKNRNLNTAVLGLDPVLLRVGQSLVDWRECALNVDCIAPEGSSRKNHRQDQAAFTVIAYRNKLIERRRSISSKHLWEPVGISIHSDIEKVDRW